MMICRCGHDEKQHYPDNPLIAPNGQVVDYLNLTCGSCNECKNFIPSEEDNE